MKTTNKMRNIILVLLVLAAIALVVLGAKNKNVQAPDTTGGVVVEHPVIPPTGGKVAQGYAAGHITIGPNCPVERVDQPCPPPPQAYSSRQVVVYAGDANTVKTKGKIDAAGNYKIALSPGTYFLQIQPAGIGPGEKKKALIASSQTSAVDFDIDTGIR